MIIIVSHDENLCYEYADKVMILDDGKEIIIKDFLGFAEDVFNKW